MITVRVPLGARAYDVLVGHGVRDSLGGALPASARQVAIVSQSAVPLDVDVPLPSHRFEIGVGERHKTLATIELLCRGFAEIGLTRHDVIVAVGGGMVTDVAGFAAASWHRGTAVVNVPTTLLGMVDAAIGGKTAVNIPEGKNLVGAIWQPSAVVCDLDALATLPERELRCGYGEMAKYHFLTEDDLLGFDEAERIARCVAIKAEVVAADEREAGRRALLNYGHTLAHALEIATEHAIAHGEAVAIGLLYAAHLARVLGRVGDEAIERHLAVVRDAYGLAVDLPAGLDPDLLVELMRRDKKAIGSLTFVLAGPNGPEVVVDVPESAVRAALTAMPTRAPATRRGER